MADVTSLTLQLDPENHGHHIHHLLQSYSYLRAGAAAMQCSATVQGGSVGHESAPGMVWNYTTQTSSSHIGPAGQRILLYLLLDACRSSMLWAVLAQKSRGYSDR